MNDPPLPPKPDVTGQPRPPAAPTIVGPWTDRHLTIHHHSYADHVWLYANNPSGGVASDLERVQGRAHPVLERVRAAPTETSRERVLGSLKFAVGTALVVGILGASFIFVIGEMNNADKHTIAYVAVLAALFVALFGIGLFQSSEWTSMGATAHLVQGAVGTTLPMYELTEIMIKDARNGPNLRLAGHHVNGVLQTVWLPLGMLEGNQQMWDLVYNGIRHSTAAGAEVDDRTRARLFLPPRDATDSSRSPA